VSETAAIGRDITLIDSGPAAGPLAAGLRIVAPPHRDERDTVLAEASDPRPGTRRLAQAIAEVLAGARSPSQLSGLVSLDVLRLLERRYGRFNAAPGAAPTRPIVRSVHVSEPQRDVAEACAVITVGHRVRAIALRLDAVNGRWRCTALRIG
jgi:Family of unknown function (DUF6459)